MPRTSHFARRYLLHTHLARRGQALLVAVLVLFAVATLAALFTAIIGAQLSQVARHGDVTKLRNLTEAGLWLANEQLTYSVKGADWRPPDDPYLFGDGRIELSVTYWPPPPSLAQGAFSPSPQSGRFILITSTATFPDYPFLRYTMAALKPLLLTDYARFITDRRETGRPARLGVSGVELGGTPRPDYLFRVQGPIRSNTDLVAYGRSSVTLQTADDPAETGSTWAQLGIPRDDRIEVAGFLRPDPSHPVENRGADALALTVSGEPRASDLFLPLDEAQADDYAAAFPDWSLDPSILHTSSRILADLPGYTSVGGWFPGPANSVPRVQPPDLLAEHPDTFRKRYLLLTRDSGVFEPDAATGDLHNTGEYGWGFMNLGGIYIDNIYDIQYDHDLEMLRLNWLRSVGAHDPLGDERPDADAPLSGPADWWDKTGRYYSPPAVEIVLHGEQDCPYIEIIRHDPRSANGEQYYWCDLSGAPITPTSHPADYVPTPYESNCGPGAAPGTFRVKNNTAIFPFPPNGVIYAEGNVRIRGIMPPIRDELGNSGTSVPLATAEKMPYFAPSRTDEGRARRFDLQVVSAGTIYVEGDLLTPASAGLIADTVEVDRHYGSRLALLARDYVCVNTTALNPRPIQLLDPFLDPATDEYYFYNDRYPDYPPGGYPRHLVFQGTRDPVFNSADYAKAWNPPTDPPFETDPLNIQFLYQNVRLQYPYLSDQIPDLRLMLGHSGFYALGDPEGGFDGAPLGDPLVDDEGTDEPAVDVDIYFDNIVAGTTRLWDVADTDRYTFVRPVATPGAADQSDHWYLEDDRLEHLPNGFQQMQVHPSDLPTPYLTGNNDVITFTSRVHPVRDYDGDGNIDGWHIFPRDLAYILGPVAVAPPCRLQGRPTPAAPLPVSIEAMIYAQNGSWFIIPGPWFNEDPEENTYTGDSPGYREPLNIQISVYGAVTENMPADIGAAAEWTSKWSGPQTRGFGGYLRYAYDPLLRWSRWDPDSKTWAPRFPNLPVTSDMLIWGERVSGRAGS